MTVHIEKSGPVTTVINDRINARNAGDPQTADALTEAFLAFDADPDAKVAVFGQKRLTYLMSGLTTGTLGKRPKSRSADHSSLTPCCRHKAAMRAS